MEDCQPVVQCRNCAYIYCNPVPAEADLFDYYHESYEDWDNWEKTFRHDRQWVFRQGLRRIRQRKADGRLLDVGCSLGIFLESAREAGFDCYGVEVSHPAATFARERLKLNVLEGTLEAAAFDTDFFDVVTMWDVLEHVTDPAGMVDEIHRILKPGGLLAMRVPNVSFHLLRSRIVSRVRPSKDIGLDTINHLNHFSARTLSTLLQRHGFTRPSILPGAPNIYGRRSTDLAKHCYDILARTTHTLIRREIATILEAYAVCEASPASP